MEAIRPVRRIVITGAGVVSAIGSDLETFGKNLFAGRGGIGDAILVRGETAPGQSLRLAYNILQAAGTRIFKTDYVACPSCGRTLFNLQHTTQKIRAATGHLKGVRIAVMGCIVNGPGESKHANIGISLPGTGENPVAPVYEDGAKTVTLKGDRIAEEFQELVERYIERTYARTP